MADPQIFYGSGRTLSGFYVQQASSSISWGDTGSTTTLTVVKQEDFNYGYNDFPAVVSHPMRFSYGVFFFGGILSKVTKKKVAGSGMSYELTIVDPKEILQSTQVVIGQYQGAIPQGVGNIINVFGYLESFGFGYSGNDDIGMPWTSFVAGLLAICNQPSQTPYGGPMRWGIPNNDFPNSVSYSLDLSELPIPDPYYRIEGNYVVSLFDVISKLCQDAGFDFLVELVGYSIKIRTINRKVAPALGTIGAIVNSPETYAVSNEYGIEMAQGQQTASMLIGAPLEGVFPKTNYRSFWGYDANKNMILGHSGTMMLLPKARGDQTITYPVEMMNLYAQGVEDVIGGSYYFCTTLELQFALAGIDSWMEFIEQYRPDIFFATNGYMSTRAGRILINGVNTGDLVQTDSAALIARAMDATYDRSEGKRRFFQWLSGIAQQHLGKEFIVSLGVAAATINPSNPFDASLRPSLKYEFDIVRSAFMEIDSAPLGLSPLAASQFTDEQNKFEPFVLYNYQRLTQANAKIEDPQNTVFDALGVYVKASLGDKIETMLVPTTVSPYSASPFMSLQIFEPVLFLGGPLVRVTIQTPIFSRPTSPVGDHVVVSRVLGTPVGLFQVNSESSKTRVSPPAVMPSSFAIPLKSNKFTYGPFWTYSPVPGRVNVSVDSDLAPWNFGSESVMNQVAIARLFDGASQLCVTEHGRVTMPGAPSYTLGQTMQANGPAITSIEVSFGNSGVTSTYAFQNFSPRFGVVPRQMTDRLRKTGQMGLMLRRGLYKLQVERARTQQSVARAALGTAALAMSASAFDKYHRVQTPHECIGGFAIADSSGLVRLNVSTAPLHEFVSNTRASEPLAYVNRAITSTDAIFRPYRSPLYNTNYQVSQNGKSYRSLPDGLSLLPKSEMLMVPISGVLSSYELNAIAYPHWTDISLVTYQKQDGTPCEINTYRDNVAEGAYEARSVGLRGPVVVVGYGLDVYNGVVTPTGVLTGNGHVSRDHKAGPVDLMWDDFRKVWTGAATARVLISNYGAPGAPVSGYLYFGNTTTNKMIAVYPQSSEQSLSYGDTIATYVSLEGKWYACGGGGSSTYLGTASQDIYGNNNGLANLFIRGSSTVYNYLNNAIPSGAKIIVSNSFGNLYIIAADC